MPGSNMVEDDDQTDVVTSKAISSRRPANRNRRKVVSLFGRRQSLPHHYHHGSSLSPPSKNSMNNSDNNAGNDNGTIDTIKYPSLYLSKSNSSLALNSNGINRRKSAPNKLDNNQTHSNNNNSNNVKANRSKMRISLGKIRSPKVEQEAEAEKVERVGMIKSISRAGSRAKLPRIEFTFSSSRLSPKLSFLTSKQKLFEQSRKILKEEQNLKKSTSKSESGGQAEVGCDLGEKDSTATSSLDPKNDGDNSNNVKEDSRSVSSKIDFGRVVRRRLRKMSDQELLELIASDDTAPDNKPTDVAKSEYFGYSNDNKLLEIVDQIPRVKSLNSEYDELKARNKELAMQNYAREPEFVRNRMRLHGIIEDMNALKVSLTTRHVKPIMDLFTNIESSLKACADEKYSEQIPDDFLEGKLSHTEFLEKFIKAQKEYSKRRVIADMFTRERVSLESNIPKLERGQSYAPVPAQRQRRRASFKP